MDRFIKKMEGGRRERDLGDRNRAAENVMITSHDTVAERSRLWQYKHGARGWLRHCRCHFPNLLVVLIFLTVLLWNSNSATRRSADISIMLLTELHAVRRSIPDRMHTRVCYLHVYYCFNSRRAERRLGLGRQFKALLHIWCSVGLTLEWRQQCREYQFIPRLKC